MKFSQQKATSSTVTPEVADYRTKASEWVVENEKKYKRPMSPHLQVYRSIFLLYSILISNEFFVSRFPSSMGIRF